MSAAVFVLRGHPGGDQTAFLLERYREAAASPGAALWLTPTEHLRAHLLPQLVPPGGALLAPHLCTFPDFARRVVHAARPSARSLPELHQRLILDAVLADLRDRKELPGLGRVSDGRGFRAALFALLSEWKGRGVTPLAFARAAYRASGVPRKRLRRERPAEYELARVFAAYQKRLHAHRLTDRDAAYAEARRLLGVNRWGPFEAVRLVVADGFADWTPPQFALLEALARKADRLWLTLPLDPADAVDRAELFGRPLHSLTRACQLPRSKLLEVQAPAPAGRPAGLAHLRDHLFRPERSVPRLENAAGVRVIAAPGLVGEVRMVARAVKERLLSGASPAEVVVAARELSPYVDLVRELFAEYGVPLEADADEALTRNPAVAALVRAARLGSDDFPFAATAALLRSGYFQPAWAEVGRDPEVPRHAEALLRMLGESRGRDLYLSGVDQWADAPPAGLEDEQAEAGRRRRQHRLATRCRRFLKR